MAGVENHPVRHPSSGMFTQSVVVCLLALFIIIALIAMFSTIGVSDEMVWIGMTARPLDAEETAALGIPSDAGGVMVEEVDGIAQTAGVRHGDVLFGVNGEPIRDVGDFLKLAKNTDLSRRGVQLDIIRRGVRIPVLVLPSSWPSTAATERPGRTTPGGTVSPPVVLQGLWDRSWLGIEAETLAAGEGRELRIPAGVGGVLVESVAAGSLAGQVGLAVNDVIVSVNGQRTDAAADLWNALAGLGPNGVEFGVYRGGRLMSVLLPAALGTLAGGFDGRMGRWGLGPGGFPFCPGGRFVPVAQPAASGTLPGVSPGRMGGWGLGPGGFLVCPSCGARVAHQRGVPCFTVPCPSCGTMMIRAQ